MNLRSETRERPTHDLPEGTRDARVTARYPYALAVRRLRMNGTEALQTLNISRAGMFLEATCAPDERALVKLEFQLEGVTFHAAASVTRVTPDGFAVRFVGFGGAEKEAWNTLVEQVAEQDRHGGRKDAPAYHLRFANRERLMSFYQTHYQAGRPYRIQTPLVQNEGQDIVLWVRHPQTEEPYALRAEVLTTTRDTPRAMEVLVFTEDVPPARPDPFFMFACSEA